MSNNLRAPSSSTVVKLLAPEVRALYETDCDDSVDVRLCVETDGSFCVRTGDVSYDTHHSAHCGAASIWRGMSDEDVADVATDLCGQVADSIAMDA